MSNIFSHLGNENQKYLGISPIRMVILKKLSKQEMLLKTRVAGEKLLDIR